MKIGLYVHIPFCASKCHYCDFLSFPGGDQKAEYVEALVSELKSYSARIKGVHTISSIFIGGGTPTVLPSFLLQALCETIKDYFVLEEDYEWTIEANPGTITQEHVDVMVANGVNRVSLGLQTTKEILLKRIGRCHTLKDWQESIELLLANGITNINTDLMFALPGQTLLDWQEDLELVTSYPITHLSAYALILEEGTPLYHKKEEGIFTFPTDEEDRQMYDLAKQVLKQKGFKQYEISNWAKDGKCCKQNILYWQCGQYIGVGLGAHGYLADKRYNNNQAISEYIVAKGDISQLVEYVETVSKKMSREEFMFLGLRLTEGITTDEFYQKFGQELFDIYGEAINKWIKQGAIVHKNSRIYLTDYGIDLSNQIFASFL